MKIKIDKADAIFSKYIRKRDLECVRCGSPVRVNDNNEPISHQCSHYFGRGQESTRFDPNNCDTLCHACHVNWGSAGKEDYRAFKIKQLGQAGFDALLVKSKTYCKKDRAMAYLIAKELYDRIVKKD